MGKIIFDRALAALLLAALSPLIGMVAIFVRLRLGRPILLRQRRPGLNGKIFTIYKFRTMTDERDEQGNLLPDEKRITKAGAFLRSSSLDELPELWNILRGDMSFVGPRPLLPDYLPLYSPRQARRHDVLPGLTGWAQVNGRNATNWEDRLEMDAFYVENQSFLFDMRILAMTAKTLVSQSDVSHEGHVTMPRFTGSPDRL